MSTPANQLPAPYLDPSQYPDYLDAQKKQMLASALMNSMQQQQQTPDNWNSMKVVPRRSLISTVAPLVTALMAGKAQNASLGAQQKYFTGLYGGGSGGQSAAPASTGPGSGIVSPDASQADQDQAAAVTAGQAPAQQSAPTPQRSSLILPGMAPGTAQQLLGMMGPEKYGEMVSGQWKPAEIATQLRSAGIDPNGPLGRQIQQTAIAKATNIAPIDVHPGGTLYDPITHQPIATAPQNGVNTTWSGGQPSASLVPGADTATAAMTGAETGARVANTPSVIPTAGGGSTYAYPGDVLHQAPPALRPPAGTLPQSPTQAQPTAAPAGASAPAPNAAPGPPAAQRGLPPSTASHASAQAPSSPWATMPKLNIPTGVGAPDAFTASNLKGASDKHIALATQFGQEADLADQKMNYNREALAALPTAEVGPVSEFLTENRAKLAEWGVPASLVPGSGSVTPTFELNKNLLNSALQGAKQIYGARMTGNEVMLQKNEASPSVTTSRDAIQSLIQQDNAKNSYFKQRASDYGAYVQKVGDPTRFESWYSSNFPLQTYAQKYAFAQTPGAQQAIQLLDSNPKLAPAFKAKYGFLPDGFQQ